MAENEIVVNPHLVAAGQKQLDRVAADVTRSAGDENAHGAIIATSAIRVLPAH